MSNRKPKTFGERLLMADENADLGTAIANAMGIIDRDGRNVHDRIMLNRNGQLGAASYDGPGVHTSGHSDPTATAVIEHTDMNAPDKAIATSGRFDALLWQINRDTNELANIVAKELPRPATRSEAIATSVEEAQRDPGCQSCARYTKPNGQKRWSATYRTSDVRKDPKNADTARLDTVTRLCRDCYEKVLKAAPGMQFTLGVAIPRSFVRALAEGRRRYERVDAG